MAVHRPLPLRGCGAVAVVLLPGLSGCGRQPAPDPAPPAPALSAELVQHRADVVRRVVQV